MLLVLFDNNFPRGEEGVIVHYCNYQTCRQTVKKRDHSSERIHCYSIGMQRLARYSSFRRQLSLSSVYSLTAECPPPTITTGETHCECTFPPSKQLNTSTPLNGTATSLYKHVLVYTGQPAQDWESRIELAGGSLAAEFARFKRATLSPIHPVAVSNIDLESPFELPEDTHCVHVYPDNKLYLLATTDVEKFMKEQLTPDGQRNEPKFEAFQNDNELILICGHTKRDLRCGLIAPMLVREFEAVLAAKGLLYDRKTNSNGIKVGVVSHIGGHAYAGNVIYFDENGLAIWYGRVKNSLADGIVEETVINKRIIEHLFRGRYNIERQ